MKSNICDYIVGRLRAVLTAQQHASAEADVSALLIQPIGSNGLGLSTGSVITFALDIEQHFAIRFAEQGIEQLAVMTPGELIDLILTLVNREQAVQECVPHELPTRTDILQTLASLTGQEVEDV